MSDEESQRVAGHLPAGKYILNCALNAFINLRSKKKTCKMHQTIYTYSLEKSIQGQMSEGGHSFKAVVYTHIHKTHW